MYNNFRKAKKGGPKTNDGVEPSLQEEISKMSGSKQTPTPSQESNEQPEITIEHHLRSILRAVGCDDDDCYTLLHAFHQIVHSDCATVQGIIEEGLCTVRDLALWILIEARAFVGEDHLTARSVAA